MPMYEYACPRCGDFTAMQSCANYTQPYTCPECDQAAPRVMRTAPSYFGMPTAQRKAHSVNEQAMHQPKVASELKRTHGPGCSCCAGTKKSNAVQTKSGEKGFPNKRPWMISH